MTGGGGAELAKPVVKIEQLLRQLEQVVEEDSSEALSSHRSTQPDDQAAEVRGDHAQGHAAQGNDDDAATEEPLSKLARACMESAWLGLGLGLRLGLGYGLEIRARVRGQG